MLCVAAAAIDSWWALSRP